MPSSRSPCQRHCGPGRALSKHCYPSRATTAASRVDLLIGAEAESAGVPVVHYDRDYERLASVSSLDARWLMPDGALAPASQNAGV
jgi:hypothetical protein